MPSNVARSLAGTGLRVARLEVVVLVRAEFRELVLVAQVRVLVVVVVMVVIVVVVLVLVLVGHRVGAPGRLGCVQ